MIGSLPRFFLWLMRRHPGEVVRFGRVYLVADPAHLEEVLVTRAKDFDRSGGMWDAVKLLLGNGLITADGESWRQQRRHAQPVFSAEAMSGLESRVQSIVEEECDAIAAGPEVVDLSQPMRRVARRVVLEGLFGSDVPSGVEAHLAVAMRLLDRHMQFWMLPRPVRLPMRWVPGHKRFLRAIAEVDRCLEQFDPPFLQGLTLSAAERRDMLVNFYVGGTDTVGSALESLACAWTQWPERCEASAPEVIVETLRLYPPIFMDPRYAAADTQVGGVRVPAGSILVLLPIAAQRDPRYWQNADEFNPARRDVVPRFARLPFGAGQHKCVGERLALLELTTMHEALSRRFRLQPARGADFSLTSAATLGRRSALARHQSAGASARVRAGVGDSPVTLFPDPVPAVRRCPFSTLFGKA